MLKISTTLITVTSFYAVFIVIYYASKFSKIKENEHAYSKMNIIKFLSIKPLNDYNMQSRNKLFHKKKISIGFDNNKESKQSYNYIIKILNKESHRSKGVYFNTSNDNKDIRLKKLLHIARSRSYK